MNSLQFRFRSPFFLLLLAAALSLGAVAAFSQGTSGGIRESMSPEQFKAAGLEKLTPTELAKLDAFLQGDREKAVEKGSKREKLQLTVSRVDGVIDRISSGQTILLEDGSVWKLAKVTSNYRGQADHPGAAVYKTFFGWKMRIGNVGEFYVVPVRH